MSANFFNFPLLWLLLIAQITGPLRYNVTRSLGSILRVSWWCALYGAFYASVSEVGPTWAELDPVLSVRPTVPYVRPSEILRGACISDK